MTDPSPTYDASPCHYETVPIGALSAKSHALTEALAENERLRARCDEWQAVAEDRSRKYLEARGAWQVASDDRERLERENADLRRRLDNALVGGKESDG